MAKLDSTTVYGDLTVTGTLKAAAGSGGAIVDDSVPAGTPAQGSLWYNPSYGALMVYVDDAFVVATKDGKNGANGAPGISPTITFGTTAGTSCEGNDTRLSNTRTPSTTSITYDKYAASLTSSITDNDGAYDFSAAGIIYTTLSTTTAVTFSNLQQNKTLKMKLVISGTPTITFPAYCKKLAGSQTLTAGTFYLYFDCWESAGGSELVIYSIMKEG
jgi:hypothetical protein